MFFFALHPLHAEPVAWVSARKDLLSGVFFLGALLVLLDWFPLRRAGFGESGSGNRSWKTVVRKQLRSKSVYLGMALGAALVTISVQGEGTHRDFAAESSLGERLADAPGHLAFYLQRLFWPTDLVFEYSRAGGIGEILYPVTGSILSLPADATSVVQRLKSWLTIPP